MTEDDLPVPSPRRVGTFRDYLEALAQATPPTAIAAHLLGIWFPTALEASRVEFQEKVAARLAALVRDVVSINERLAAAALAEGCLSAARSATEEHLDYLANATARVMLSTSERETRGMILLRIAGDLSADHVRVMRMYADPEGAAASAGVDLVWQECDDGRFRLRSVVESIDPELASDRVLVEAVMGDIERFGLTGHRVGTFDVDSIAPGDGESIIGDLGHELLALVEPVNDPE